MGSCVSSPGGSVEAPSTPEKARSAAIDRQIAEDERNFKKECKILLLGSGESGKSTIVKQMKIIHLHGYTPDELVLYRAVVNRNVVESAQALVQAMRKFGLDAVVPANRAHAQKILDFTLPPAPTSLSLASAAATQSTAPTNAVFSATLPPDLGDAIAGLTSDPVISAVMDRSNEFYLMDSAAYFFGQIARIARRDYVPNTDDVLRARAQTTGITETRFTMGPLFIQSVYFASISDITVMRVWLRPRRCDFN